MREPPSKALRVPDVVLRKANGPKLTMLTAYDAAFARLLAPHVDILLVGDSLGMVQLGYSTTLPVTMGDMVRHTRSVRAGAPNALIVSDMPFLSHQVSPAQALRNAGRLIQAGATAVKIEGGAEAVGAIERIVSAGIPVMGHLGLQPQSVHALGGFRRQARTPEEQERLLNNGRALQDAGVFAVVLESVPDAAARAFTEALSVPVIGIGSGPHCDGQVLVTHDILGLSGRSVPPFAKRYADGENAVALAAEAFADEVRSGKFPRSAEARGPEVIRDVPSVREALVRVRRSGAEVGLVPTMGALHRGHASLLAQARRENQFVIASIFVNPLQFDRKEDLERYPQTLAADLELCRNEGVDLVFAPGVQDLYPHGQLTFVESPALGKYLCGEHRPGHFQGVETVVLKLLNIVQPQRAYFGKKDAQQLVMIQRMVDDLNVPVVIVPVETVRESDGLALSSRNQLLTPEQRAVAPVLSQALSLALQALKNGERSPEAVRSAGMAELSKHPEVRVEYFELTDPETLHPLTTVQKRALIAGAVWLGKTRLIDNRSWQEI